MKILITGATGFLGQYLVNELSPQFETIYILSRNENFDGFKHLSNVQLIAGDITDLQIFKRDDVRDLIIEQVDYVVHAAALYDLTASHSDCYLQNIVGTQNLLRLLKKMKKIKVFYYISTIAVGDDQSLILEENGLPVRKNFNDFYSETKYFAEKMVREMHSNIATRIIRPGILIGDSNTGKISKTDGPYFFLKAMEKHSMLLKNIPFIPLSFAARTRMPLIPVDHCARFIALLINRDFKTPDIITYHLISSEIPTVEEFLKDLNQVFGLKTRYIPILKNPLHDSLLNRLGIPKEVIPFMFSKLSYDRTNTLKALPEIHLSNYNTFKSILFKRGP